MTAGPDTEHEPTEGRWATALHEIVTARWTVAVGAVVLAVLVGSLMIAFTDERVQEASVYLFARPGDTVVYACGSEAMIASAYDAFTGRGLPAKRVISDALVSSN